MPTTEKKLTEEIINYWLQQAIEMAERNVASGEGPFAALIVREGELVSSEVNRTVAQSDPTAHAELLAIQAACRQLRTEDLSDCILFASGEPCPMCMGAIYWANLQSVYYACSKQEASESVGFTDPLSSFYADMAAAPAQREIAMAHVRCEDRLQTFERWAELGKR